MSRADEFEELRPLLFSIAYRLLGSVAEAEDAVQETWLRYEATATQPRSTRPSFRRWSRGSLSTCSDRHASPGDVRRSLVPRTTAHRSQSGSRSLRGVGRLGVDGDLLLLERLSPLERAVFVLREVFDFCFPEIASAVDRSEAACRQLAVRARGT